VNLSEVLFPDVDDVKGFHVLALSQNGGSDGIRDLGMLESAVFSIQKTAFGVPLHATLAAMAAALGYSIAKNHAFVDGNKRVAAIATLAFLEVNGFPLKAPERDWIELFVRVAAGNLTMRSELQAAIVSLMGCDVKIEADDLPDVDASHVR
jgi:death-on-curing protein